jgi:hypothetical protein
MPCQPPSVEQQDSMHSMLQIRRRYLLSSTTTTGNDGIPVMAYKSQMRSRLKLKNTNDRAAYLISILDEALDVCNTDFES